MMILLLILTSAAALCGGLLIGMQIKDIHMQEEIFTLKAELDDKDESWAIYCQDLHDELVHQIEMNSKFKKIKSCQ